MYQDTMVERRVTDLEELMSQLLRTVERVDRQIERTQRQVERTQRQVDQTSWELREFKVEMSDFKTEMSDFKTEMSDFKTEMSDFKTEMRRAWGELANKMGTMAEDLVAPSVPRILRETVGCPSDRVEYQAVRVRKTHPTDPGRSREFDVVAVCGEYVLINETKGRLNAQIVDEFAQRMPEAREFLAEYAAKKFIGAIASLYVDESVVRYGEKRGLIVLGFGQDVMDVLNSPGFVPKAF